LNSSFFSAQSKYIRAEIDTRTDYERDAGACKQKEQACFDVRDIEGYVEPLLMKSTLGVAAHNVFVCISQSVS
jgi:hypothetical protein